MAGSAEGFGWESDETGDGYARAMGNVVAVAAIVAFVVLLLVLTRARGASSPNRCATATGRSTTTTVRSSSPRRTTPPENDETRLSWAGLTRCRYGWRQASTVVQPYSSGATSAIDSVNVQWWPARSSALYCRSPYM